MFCLFIGYMNIISYLFFPIFVWAFYLQEYQWKFDIVHVHAVISLPTQHILKILNSTSHCNILFTVTLFLVLRNPHHIIALNSSELAICALINLSYTTLSVDNIFATKATWVFDTNSKHLLNPNPLFLPYHTSMHIISIAIS